MTRTPTPSYGEGQQRLLEAARIIDNPAIEHALDAASVEVLEWFLRTVEFDTAEPHYWIASSPQDDELAAWQRRLRTLAAAALHDKKQAA